MDYGLLELFEKYEKIEMDEKEAKIISMIKEYLIICEDNVYTLKEKSI